MTRPEQGCIKGCWVHGRWLKRYMLDGPDHLLYRAAALSTLSHRKRNAPKHWHTQQPPRKASTCDKPLLFNATVKVKMEEIRLRSHA